MKPLTLLLCLPCLALAKPPSQPVPVPDDIRVEKDVSYLANDRKEKADLYFPKTIAAGEKLPAIVFIHGGGFNDGDKARQREVSICSDLARGGYVAMSINYKLWNKGVKHPTWPQSVYDAKTAVRWLRKNAATIGINPDRIGAIGGSAGGNLASMLAVTGPADGLDPKEPLVPFEFWGPTCDSIDHMKGPFLLPASVREGDYIEIGNIGAYGRALATRFNGYGAYHDVILQDEPMYSIYLEEQARIASKA